MHLGEPYWFHCNDVEETRLHVLRDCPLRMLVWLNLLRLECREDFFNCNLMSWINLNMETELGWHKEVVWTGVWATACCAIWFWRNKCHHDENFIYSLRPWLDVEMKVRCHDIASSKVATLKNNAATENIMRYPHKGVG